jgi:hypothetical protein
MNLPRKTYQAFFDELTKIALSEADVPEGTRITNSLDTMKRLAKPGDIVATKGSKVPLLSASNAIVLFQKLRGAPDDISKWNHTGIYIGDGTIRHSYPGFKTPVQLQPDFTSKVRDQTIDRLEGLGRDFLIMRPQVPTAQKAEALERSADVKGTPFSITDFVRAGFCPKKGHSSEVKKEFNESICTAIIAHAYPSINFGHGKSIKTLMPSDIISNRKLKPIIAYTENLDDKTK